MNTNSNQILLYLGEEGAPLAEVRMDDDTLWLNQKQMSVLFGKDVRTINEHIRNVLVSGELQKDSVIRKFRITAQDGKIYQTIGYNLDMIISVGYRVNSIKGTRFRQWATGVLREHLMQGYSLDRHRFESNASELEAAMSLIRKTAQSPELRVDTGRGLLDIVTRYAQTFLILQRYDDGLLAHPHGEIGGQLASMEAIREGLLQLKYDLMGRGEATDWFAKENGTGLESLWGNLEQTVFGEAAYPTIESKAAHLLYFVIKNHPFVDGNKRAAAYLFVDFLNRNGRLCDEKGELVINDIGLAALALLVAESDPSQKPVMISLVMNMLAVVVPEQERNQQGRNAG